MVKTPLLLPLCMVTILSTCLIYGALLTTPKAWAESDSASEEVEAQDASAHMMGRQSHNRGLFVLPAKTPPTIDGNLDDWDWSGRIWSFADWDIRETTSVESAAMYDEENLYLAFRWKDTTPMQSLIDSELSPTEGWRADSVQMRIRTDRNIWLTSWYFTEREQPVLHFSYWKNDRAAKDGQEIILRTAEPGGTDLGDGVEMAYKKDEDGLGFVQEVKIPWSLLYREVPDIEPGMVFQMGLEFLWGADNPVASSMPNHRYADNLQPTATSREFFWTAVTSWGDALLVEEGGLTPREYALPVTRPDGVLRVVFEVPEDAHRMTAVIEDSEGTRVRNLVADVMPQDFQIGLEDGQRKVEVPWDGLDDEGNLVAPGEYRIRGLTRGEILAFFDSVFYNPGTPSWQTADGSGAFGSNHANPSAIVRCGDVMVIGYHMSEGQHALIGIGPEDRKIWGDRRGALHLAADDQYFYAVSVDVWSQAREPVLLRLTGADGKYAPFELNGEERTFDLTLKSLLGDDEKPETTGLAVGPEELVLTLEDGRVVFLDKASAEVRRTFTSENPLSSPTFSPDGSLYAIHRDRVVRVDQESGEIERVGTPQLGRGVAIAFDAEGNHAVVDRGDDSNVKLYSPQGRLLATFGKEGGRPLVGKYDPTAMMRPSSIAYDPQGRLWVTEFTAFPRRVSVWNPDGKLDTDFVGGTGYAASGTYLHDSDPNLAYVGPIEIKLDREKGTEEITRILWTTEDRHSIFHITHDSHVHPQRFRSSAGGEEREFLFVGPERGPNAAVLYMEREDGEAFRPVAAIGNVIASVRHDRHGKPLEEPHGPFAGRDVDDGFYWNDLNGDGEIQENELTFVPAPEKRGHGVRSGALPSYAGWSARMSPEDLAFAGLDFRIFRPVEFGSDGAPRYGPEGMETLEGHENRHGNDFWLMPGEDLLIAHTGNPPLIRGIDTKTSELVWSYPNPYHSVHGSHRAPLSRPGMLVGPLKAMGVADMGGDIGNVFAIRGNLGEDYFFTSDGFFVGALFQDGRLPTPSLPATVAELEGRPLNDFSEGGEPFSGWFGRQSDGRVRMGTSISRTSGFIVEVRGLDSISRFEGPAFELDAQELAEADADNADRAAAAMEPELYTIRRMEEPPTIDGEARDWQGIPQVTFSNARARLAYDDENLYSLFQVTDPIGMLNSGNDFTELFKSGAAVDVQFAIDTSAPVDRRTAAPGDSRIVFSIFEGEPVAVLMRQSEADAPESASKTYSSPVGTVIFDRVEILKDAEVAVRPTSSGYMVEAVVPLSAIDLNISPGMEIRGDLGYITSDAEGIVNTSRNYWSNPNTGLVNDLPGEAVVRPDAWGIFQFAE